MQESSVTRYRKKVAQLLPKVAHKVVGHCCFYLITTTDTFQTNKNQQKLIFSNPNELSEPILLTPDDKSNDRSSSINTLEEPLFNETITEESLDLLSR